MPNGNCTGFIPRRCFGRVFFDLRVSPSITIDFLKNFSAMFLGMEVGEVVSLCLPHNCLGSALCYVDFVFSQILSSTQCRSTRHGCGKALGPASGNPRGAS